jgi:hypothetical protein
LWHNAWERTGLVARPVFKTGEAVARRLVGSIPTRSRQPPAMSSYSSGRTGRRFDPAR